MFPASNTSAASSGIILLLASNFCLAGMDAVSKVLIQTYDVGQILWVRYAFFAAFTALLAWRSRGSFMGMIGAFRTDRPWLNILRAAILVIEIGCFVVAFAYMKLASVHAIAAICPLIITALSAIVLREGVGPRRWAAVGVGFIGMMIILRPGLGVFEIWALLPLLGATLFAVYQIMTKILGRTDRSDTIMLYTAWVGLAMTTTVGPFQWTTPDATGWGLLFLGSVLGMTAHLMLIKALEFADASVLQPFNYTLMVFATIIGFLVFSELPDGFTILGASIIVVSGLYAWWRERVRAATG